MWTIIIVAVIAFIAGVLAGLLLAAVSSDEARRQRNELR